MMIKLWGKERGENHNRGRTQPPRSGLVQPIFSVIRQNLVVKNRVRLPYDGKDALRLKPLLELLDSLGRLGL